MKSRSLLAQVLAINLLLVCGTSLVAVLAVDLNLRSLTAGREAIVLALAVVATFLGNALLLRRRFRPLEALVQRMDTVDLSSTSGQVPLPLSGSEEVARLTRTFNSMLARLEVERRQASMAAVRGQEKERERIARDLHDEVNQALTAVLLRLEAAAQGAPQELRRDLRETKALAQQAMEELLAIARQLRPTTLDDHGLIAALTTQVRDFGEQTGITTSFRRHGEMSRLSAEQQLVIYRVTQESLSNAAQHAGAASVDVELSFVGATVLSVTDDGRGFRKGRDGGLGLSGMRERALLAGGRLSIYSEDGQGTRVELRI